MGYRLKEAEPAPDGIKRITLDQIDRAVERLSLKTRNRDRAIHEARVCFKKIRAVLRLAQRELGRELFSVENREYRDLGRRLATARDTAVVTATLEELVRHYTNQGGEPDFKVLRKRLRRSRVEHRIDIKKIVPPVVEELSVARRRVASWPLNTDGFPALQKGIQRVYKRGRNSLAIVGVERTTENMHEWRKQVKYLWYQITVLNPIWPKPLGVLAHELSRLADFLSEDHDLALLGKTAIEQGETLANPEEVERLILLIGQRRSLLQTKAMNLGARVYAEKPSAFARRLEAYWEAWRPLGEKQLEETRQMNLSYEAASGSPST
jgi:CHAD domain-containing protein